MGFRDNFEKLNAVEQAAFGTAVTYTPADSSVPPFDGTADFGIERELIDELQPNFVADSTRCRIDHAMLASRGISAPVAAKEGHPGDTLTKKDLGGAVRVWTVVGIEPEETGSWILTLEKNLRIVPGL